MFHVKANLMGEKRILLTDVNFNSTVKKWPLSL